MEELSGDALEEGRLALLLLEKQLNVGKEREHIRTDVSVGSSRHTSQSRRKLDQAPRDIRLNNRKGSPFGLTIEELDDRGLLNGGGSNRSSSVRQKNRRPLEMRNREARLHDRNIESNVRAMNGLFHMLRILAKKGLSVESMIRERDPMNSGLLHKNIVVGILCSFGLPYSRKEVGDVVERYTATANNELDYESLLRDVGMQSLTNEDTSQSLDLVGNVLMDVKRMLLELVNSYGKSFDDIYGLFACWDAEGIGLVTSAQFLRVLSRLHIELADQEQDFLVELLDVDSMGRIDFARLLTFCLLDKTTSLDDRPSEFELTSLEPTNNTVATRRPKTASRANDVAQSSGGLLFDRDPQNRGRPTTAQARVLGGASHLSNPRQIWRQQEDDRNLIVEFPDDVIDDEQQLTPSPHAGSQGVNKSHPLQYGNFESMDIGSLNDTTLVTDQEDSHFCSPLPRSLNLPGLKENTLFPASSNLQGAEGWTGRQTLSQGAQQVRHSNWQGLGLSESVGGSLDSNAKMLNKLRDQLCQQYRDGMSLRDLFFIFTAGSSRVFEQRDVLRVLSHMEGIDANIAEYVVANIGIDGLENVTFGEFKVFVTDHEHKNLELSVHQQLAQQLERLGWQYQQVVVNISGTVDALFKETEHNDGPWISSSSFRDVLIRLGLKLGASDVQRLITRFDVDDDGFCSVGRFQKNVLCSTQWQNAVRILEIQNEAIVEGTYIRKLQRTGKLSDLPRSINVDQLSEELLCMAEFLGIRPISEHYLLWIAEDALRAPLPINWSAQKDSAGRIYFYNHISNQSRWDHPLDSHFRMLRDEHRYSSSSNFTSSQNFKKPDAEMARPHSAVVTPKPTGTRLPSTLNYRPFSASSLPESFGPIFATKVSQRTETDIPDVKSLSKKGKGGNPPNRGGVRVSGSGGVKHDYSAIPPTRKEVSKSSNLVRMFDDSVINQLDCIIAPVSSEMVSAGTSKQASSVKKIKGGIVLI